MKSSTFDLGLRTMHASVVSCYIKNRVKIDFLLIPYIYRIQKTWTQKVRNRYEEEYSNSRSSVNHQNPHYTTTFSKIQLSHVSFLEQLEILQVS
jgi:hypothetical protein